MQTAGCRILCEHVRLARGAFPYDVVTIEPRIYQNSSPTSLQDAPASDCRWPRRHTPYGRCKKRAQVSACVQFRGYLSIGAPGYWSIRPGGTDQDTPPSASSL